MGRRALKLAGARLFGESAAATLPGGAELPEAGSGTASTCTNMADLADLDEHWRKQRRLATAIQSDSDLTRTLKAVDDNVEQTSTELLRTAYAPLRNQEHPLIRRCNRPAPPGPAIGASSENSCDMSAGGHSPACRRASSRWTPPYSTW